MPNDNCARKTLFQKIYQISENISEQSDSTITKIPLFGDNKLDFVYNIVHSVSREVQLSHNDSIALLLYETFMFLGFSFFMYVTSHPLIL